MLTCFVFHQVSFLALQRIRPTTNQLAALAVSLPVYLGVADVLGYTSLLDQVDTMIVGMKYAHSTSSRAMDLYIACTFVRLLVALVQYNRLAATQTVCSLLDSKDFDWKDTSANGTVARGNLKLACRYLAEAIGAAAPDNECVPLAVKILTRVNDELIDCVEKLLQEIE